MKAVWVGESPTWTLKGSKVYAVIRLQNSKYVYCDKVTNKTGFTSTLASAKASCVKAIKNNWIAVSNILKELD